MARSGTSTMADLLRGHPKIAMGRERYGHQFRSDLPFNADLFGKERFCRDLQAGDSHHTELGPYYEGLYSRFDECTHFGDKIPNIPHDYGKLLRNFPECKVVYMLRNIFHVAYSFQVLADRTKQEGKGKWPASRGWKEAVSEWNRSIAATLEFAGNLDVFIVEYEKLYTEESLLEGLFSFLEVNVDPMVRKQWDTSGRKRTEIEHDRNLPFSSLQMHYIIRNARIDLYNKLLDSLKSTPSFVQPDG